MILYERKNAWLVSVSYTHLQSQVEQYKQNNIKILQDKGQAGFTTWMCEVGHQPPSQKDELEMSEMIFSQKVKGFTGLDRLRNTDIWDEWGFKALS